MQGASAAGDERELELSPEAMRAMVRQAMERVVPFVESLPRQPAADVSGALELARSLAEPLPQAPTPLPELLDLLFRDLLPKSFNAAGPGYLAYIPGGGIFHAAVADLIADAVNRYVGVFIAACFLSIPFGSLMADQFVIASFQLSTLEQPIGIPQLTFNLS